MNLAALGEENVRTYREYPSLVFEGRELTNVDQQRQANRLANALRRRGLGAGDRVVVLLPNCPEVLQSYRAHGAVDSRPRSAERHANVMATVIILATIGLGGVILAESALSSLGFGVPPPYPSWGAMLSGSGRCGGRHGPHRRLDLVCGRS